MAAGGLLSLPVVVGSGELRGPGAGQGGREAGCLPNSRRGEMKRLPKFSLGRFSPGCSGREDTWAAGRSCCHETNNHTPT